MLEVHYRALKKGEHFDLKLQFIAKTEGRRHFSAHYIANQFKNYALDNYPHMVRYEDINFIKNFNSSQLKSLVDKGFLSEVNKPNSPLKWYCLTSLGACHVSEIEKNGDKY